MPDLWFHEESRGWTARVWDCLGANVLQVFDGRGLKVMDLTFCTVGDALDYVRNGLVGDWKEWACNG